MITSREIQANPDKIKVTKAGRMDQSPKLLLIMASLDIIPFLSHFKTIGEISLDRQVRRALP